MNLEREREKAIRKIRRNIKDFGYHMYQIPSGPCPEYLYSIGLSESLGMEIVIAGCALFSSEVSVSIFEELIDKLKATPDKRRFQVPDFGTFELRSMDSSWQKIMLYGLDDYYDGVLKEVLQIVPDKKHFSIDIPDMTIRFDEKREPIWQWLVVDWQYPFPDDSVVITDIDAIRGKPILEVLRIGESQWQMFHDIRDNYDEEDVQIVPLGTLLAYDPTLLAALNIEIDECMSRDSKKEDWNLTE